MNRYSFIRPGATVHWTDPDSGSCSCDGVVSQVAKEKGAPVLADTEVTVRRQGTSPIGVPAKELRPLKQFCCTVLVTVAAPGRRAAERIVKERAAVACESANFPVLHVALDACDDNTIEVEGGNVEETRTRRRTKAEIHLDRVARWWDKSPLVEREGARLKDVLSASRLELFFDQLTSEEREAVVRHMRGRAAMMRRAAEQAAG